MEIVNRKIPRQSLTKLEHGLKGCMLGKWPGLRANCKSNDGQLSVKESSTSTNYRLAIQIREFLQNVEKSWLVKCLSLTPRKACSVRGDGVPYMKTCQTPGHLMIGVTSRYAIDCSIPWERKCPSPKRNSAPHDVWMKILYFFLRSRLASPFGVVGA